MELALVKYIRENGLSAAADKFKLVIREYETKILLKYNQIESPMGFEETQDARGLILEKESLLVRSLAFRKFFNAGEGHAAKIDWSTACILEKLDGSMIQVYWDSYKNEWFAATTGTAEGEGEVNNKLGTTFNQLFWKTVSEKYDMDIDFLNKNYCYIFELTTPYNIVVKPHNISSATLLTIRDLVTLEEVSREKLINMAAFLRVPVVKSFDLNAMSAAELEKTLEGMSWSEEGYVVVDANFNRIKIKNPAYVAVHHLKGKTAEHNIMEIIKTNEVDEFVATFQERKDEVYMLMNEYEALILNLEMIEDNLIPYMPKDNTNKDEIKTHALNVFSITEDYKLEEFTGLFFTLRAGKVKSVREYMKDYDNKKLYKKLTTKN